MVQKKNRVVFFTTPFCWHIPAPKKNMKHVEVASLALTDSYLVHPCSTIFCWRSISKILKNSSHKMAIYLYMCQKSHRFFGKHPTKSSTLDLTYPFNHQIFGNRVTQWSLSSHNCQGPILQEKTRKSDTFDGNQKFQTTNHLGCTYKTCGKNNGKYIYLISTVVNVGFLCINRNAPWM